MDRVRKIGKKPMGREAGKQAWRREYRSSISRLTLVSLGDGFTDRLEGTKILIGSEKKSGR